MKRIILSIILIAAVSLPASAQNQNSGKSGKNKKTAEQPPSPLEAYLVQARKAASAAPTAQSASLFSPYGSNLFLFRDPKARAQNDIVTIQIIENSTATNAANTSTSKSGDASIAAPGMFGLEKSTNMDFTKLLQANTALDFAGTGSTTRSGQLTAQLSARVVEVLPNGYLVIQGTKDVTVNKEHQALTIRGVVRPDDISPTNLVQSSVIANMEVSFDGKGILTAANHPGWLNWLFTKIMPF
jgi:flagellar L-ring protein precursor FlgH